MLFPLGTDRPLRRPTLVTPALVAVNVAVFMTQMVLRARDQDAYWSLLRPWMLHPFGRGFEWYQPITSAFMHAGWWHIAGNMLFLWVFGQNIEDRLGRFWFLLFYLGAAFGAAAAHAGFEQNAALGASGAVAGLTGAYLVMFPNTRVRVFFLFFLSFFWVSAWWVIGLAVVWDLMMAGSARGTGVAHLAHLGGVAFGAIVAFILLGLRVLPREPYDLFSLGKQAYRRRQFKEAGLAQQARVRKHWERSKRGSETASAPGSAGTAGTVANASKDARPGDRDANDEASDEVAQLRQEVLRLLDRDEPARLVEAYRRLISRHADNASSVTFGFRQHEQLAIALYPSVDKQTAAFAIERLIDAYPREQAAPRFKLLLGLLCARHLNDPIRAKSLLTEAMPDLTDEAERELAQRELADLG